MFVREQFTVDLINDYICLRNNIACPWQWQLEQPVMKLVHHIESLECFEQTNWKAKVDKVNTIESLY